MRNAVIVDSVRTGLAKSFRGGFNNTRADNMTAHIVNAPVSYTHLTLPTILRV